MGNGGTLGGSGAWDASAGNTNTNWWNGSANVGWDNGTAVFGGAAGGTVTITNGPVSAAGLTFNAAGYTVAGATATDLLSLSGTATLDGTSDAAINAILSGTAGLNKAGTNTVTLGGVNTFTGNVGITGGVLSIAADTALGNAANGITISGGTLRSTGATVTSARVVTLGAAGGTIDVAGAATNNLTLSAALAANANALTKTGVGILTLGGASTRTGTTAVSGGRIAVTNIGGLGTGAVSVSGATSVFEINTAAATSAQVVNLANGGTFQWTQNAQLTLGAPINVGAGGGTIFVGGSLSTGKVLAAAGQITSVAGSTLTKTGGGVLQLSGANTGVLGDVALSAGTIEFQNADSLGTTARTVTISGTGDLATGAATNRNNVVLAGGTLSANNPAANYTGNVSVTSNSTIALRQFQTVANANSFRIDGNLSGTANLSVTAPAAATLTLGTTPNTAGTATSNTGYTGTISVGGNATVVINQRLGSTAALTLAGGTVQYRVPNLSGPTAGSAGLTGTYYNFGSNVGTGANNFAVDQLYVSPRAFSRTDPNVFMPQPGANGNSPIVPVPGYAMGVGAQGQQDGAMWKGLLNITNAGTYTFSGTNDDNYVLIIDGTQVGTLGVVSANTTIGTAVLSAGAHSVVVKMTQGTGGGYSTLSYNGGAGSDAPTTTVIPASAFTTGSLAAVAMNPITVTTSSTIDVAQPTTVSSVTIGNQTLTVTSATIDDLSVGSMTINAATPTLAPSSGGLIFTGAIAETGGSRALNIAGPYFTEFRAANTYTGLTTVTGGQLRLNSGAGPAVAGSLTVNAANAAGLTANVKLLQSDQIADAATVTMTAGVLDVGTFNDTIANLTLSGTSQILGSGGVLTVTNAPVLNAGYVGAGLGGTYNLVKGGTGTVTLAGANTFAGVTNVNAGILNVRGPGALGATGAGNETVVAAGATLQFVGGNMPAENVTLSGTGVAELTQTGAVRNLGGVSGVNNVTTGAAATIGVDAGQFVINGALDTTAGPLTKTGVG
ncbi:MAG TPA: autotransporter-associated beta strand repeat-containing protein, partial [Humisphaera sp.]